MTRCIRAAAAHAISTGSRSPVFLWPAVLPRGGGHGLRRALMGSTVLAAALGAGLPALRSGPAQAALLYIDTSQASYSQNDAAAQQDPMIFDGGTLKPVAPPPDANFVYPVLVLATGGYVDTSLTDTTFAGAITADGPLTKQGGNTLTFEGGGSFQALSVTGGAVTLSGAADYSASSLTTSAGTTFTLASDVTFTVDTIANYGTLHVQQGTVSATSLTNGLGGAVTVEAGAALSGTLDNNGTFTNLGSTNATVNTNAGTLTNEGTWSGAVVSNAGTLTNQQSGSWTGAVQGNGGTIRNLSGASWTGAVEANGNTILNDGAGTTWTGAVLGNLGGVTNSGGALWTGDVAANVATIENTSGASWSGAVTSNQGTITNDGAGTSWTGTASNAGALDNRNGASWSGALASNSGFVTNETGASWTGAVTSNTGSLSNLSGATWTGAVEANSGTITNAGTGTRWIGDVHNALSVQNLNGASWTGDAIDNSGVIRNSGAGTSWTGALKGNTFYVYNDGASWSGTVADNSGVVSSTNSASWSGAVTGNTGYVYNSGGSTWTGAVTGNAATIQNSAGGIWTDGDITGNGGTITNTGSGTSWTGKVVSNSGVIINDAGATWTGAVAANASGAAIVSSNGSGWSGDVGNSGTIQNVFGSTWTGKVVSNAAGGSITNDASTWTGAVVTNAGTVWNQGGAIWTGAVTSNGGTITNTGGGTWSGDILDNAAGATILNTGTGTGWAGTVSGNAGTIQNQLSATWYGVVAGNTGAIVNTGAGTSWSGDVVANAGTISNLSGATWTGDVLGNAGTIVNTGTWVGSASNTDGTLATYGVWDGSIVNGRTLAAAGEITGGVSNAAGATFYVDGVTSPALPNLLVGGSVANAGTVQVLGAASLKVGGDFANAGTVSLSQGTATYNTLTVAGTYAGTAGAVVVMDIDLSSTRADTTRADLLDAQAVSGATALELRNVGANSGLFANDIVVVKGEGADDAFTATGLGSRGLIDYSLVHAGDEWAVRSTLNPSAGSLAASVAATLTAFTTGFLESMSMVVSGPADPVRDQVSYGLWARLKGGSYDMDSVSTTRVAGATASVAAASTFTSSFGGFQVGADISRSDIAGSGFTAHVGLTAGDVQLDNTLANGGGVSTSVDAPFYGAYAVLRGHGLYADVQVLRTTYGMDLTNAAARLSGAATGADGWAVTAHAGGVAPLGGSWFAEPSAGFDYATARVDEVLLPGGLGILSTDPVESLIGSLRLKVGTRIAAGQGLVLRPSVEVSVWHEFAGTGAGTFADGFGGAALFGVTGLGTFGQVGVGLAGEAPALGVLGFLQADYRFGDNISGGAFSGGMRRVF
ncbi:hypothetical protein V5F59_13475 [Xanthobacter autotrophicus DSM 431]|uniref:beta strand repeat-containing protein n=1 Tax=Xanthobacter nonsaccharivorans TaxID=3119912 RepID=UPI00372A52BD